MKLISLNIWGGHIHQPLLEFVTARQDVDIFCLQEVYHNAPKMITNEDRTVQLNILAELHACLPNHEVYFRPVVNNIYGIAALVSKDFQVLDEGEVSIYTNPDYTGVGPKHSRNMQWINFQAGEQVFSVFNIHGLWNGQGKTDTPDRIAQAHNIKNFMNTLHTPKILCGDFNLRPDTESLQIIKTDLRDLIAENNIQSTRTSYYDKDEKFADYMFVSSEIMVNDFKVLSDVVSDHAPLWLDFSM